jgi:hypothetical protein
MNFIEDTHAAITTLAITITGELGSFVMFYFAKDKIRESLYEVRTDDDRTPWIWGAFAVFFIGYFTAYAGYRLITKKWPQFRSKIYFTLATFAAGFGNLLLFYALITVDLR